jgi:acyl transferase domain-containing protein
LSARTPEALAELRQRYAARSEACDAEQLPDLCYTAAAGRAVFGVRRAVRGSSGAEIARKLRELNRAPAIAARAPQVVFLFSGQGTQYAGMLRGLAQHRVVRETLEACERVVAPWWQGLEHVLADSEKLRQVRRF